MLKQIGGFIAAGLTVVIIFFILASTTALIIKVTATLIFGFTTFWTVKSALSRKKERHLEPAQEKLSQEDQE